MVIGMILSLLNNTNMRGVNVMGKHRKNKGRFSKADKAVLIGSTTIGMIFAGTSIGNAQGYTPAWDQLADCESGSRNADGTVIPGSRTQDAYNASDPSWGYFQFIQSSWEGMGGLEFAPRADYASWDEQVIVAQRLLEAQGPDAWYYCSNLSHLVPGWEYAGGNSVPVSNPTPAPAPTSDVIYHNAVFPVAAPVTSDYGPRWGTMHQGIDIGVFDGTPIVAAKSGTVLQTGSASGYGYWVLIDHGDGTTTEYGHISDWVVSPGQWVNVGDLIAYSGSSGGVDPHLHFEVNIWGNDVDPTQWLWANGAAGDWSTGPILTSGGTPVAPETPANEPIVINPVENYTGELATHHTVRSGESLSVIADMYGTTWQAIYDLNRDIISNPDLIYPDQVLRMM
jgi:murein DD-endopeptidase MepM/ murein hydrolase activator NlpD